MWGCSCILYDNDMLPELFVDMFTPVRNIHDYNTRAATEHIFMLPFKAQLVARNVSGMLEHTYGILYSLKWIRIVP